MGISETNLIKFLKKHIKPEVIDNTFFNRSKEEKVISKYRKDLETHKKAFIPASEAVDGVDIYFNDQLYVMDKS